MKWLLFTLLFLFSSCSTVYMRECHKVCFGDRVEKYQDSDIECTCKKELK